MSNLLQSLFDADTYKVIQSVYRVQIKVYGVYVPPTLKQIMTLKELLLKTGLKQEVNPKELLGLSKIECKLLINILKKISREQEMNLAEYTADLVVNI